MLPVEKPMLGIAGLAKESNILKVDVSVHVLMVTEVVELKVSVSTTVKIIEVVESTSMVDCKMLVKVEVSVTVMVEELVKVSVGK